MSTDRLCPLKAGLICSPKCGLYSKLDERCSVSLIAEALISIVDLKGRVFTATIATGGRIGIPADIRYDLELNDGDRVKMVIVTEEAEDRG